MKLSIRLLSSRWLRSVQSVRVYDAMKPIVGVACFLAMIAAAGAVGERSASWNSSHAGWKTKSSRAPAHPDQRDKAGEFCTSDGCYS